MTFTFSHLADAFYPKRLTVKLTIGQQKESAMTLPSLINTRLFIPPASEVD